MSSIDKVKQHAFYETRRLLETINKGYTSEEDELDAIITLFGGVVEQNILMKQVLHKTCACLDGVPHINSGSEAHKQIQEVLEKVGVV